MPTPFARMMIVVVRRPVRWYRLPVQHPRRPIAAAPVTREDPPPIPFELLLW